MPRPGPRPYECVRRAWHSDRHQPIRGSLIQEIFRIVNEIHSSATKKNKEWQEKLPVVVLKAEEIMYSKANSEAEYVDVSTLWDRANDAINTIIRRDESTETGELLQPCIEAALHLGCTPRRSSRSQRNNNPRCYLNPEKPETVPVSLSNLENEVQGNCGTNGSLIPQSSKHLTTNYTCTNGDISVIGKYDTTTDYSKFQFSPKTYSPGGVNNHQCIPRQNESVSSSCAVYPLYYGNQFHFDDSIFNKSSESNSHLLKADKKDVMQKHSSCGQDGSNVQSQPHSHSQHIPETPPGSGCDLSLRLGPIEVPCLGVQKKSWPHPQEVELEGGGDALGACKVGSKPSDESLHCDNDFSFFPKANDHDRLDCSFTKWNQKAQNPNIEQSLRKRKAAGVSHPSEDRQFCWQLKLPFKQFNGRINNAD